MLTFGEQIDYELLCLNYLTIQGNESVVNTKEIAEKYNIPN